MKLQLRILLIIAPAYALEPLVHTSTGPILGSKVSPDVLAWKGIPFAVPPTGTKRWTPPVLNRWTDVKNTTALGPACIQDLGGDDPLYNNPPLAEDEDCLTINVWAPSKPSRAPRAILFWIFGNGFEYGGSGTVFYDGASFAEEQDVILVSHNYRTNLFGFPNSPELPLQERNLGLLDQHLALAWTRDNAAKFGGDPKKITIFGQSAGSGSVALLMEHFSKNPPFHGAILQSGVRAALNNDRGGTFENFTSWNSVAEHFGCLSNSTAQLACLRGVSATALKQFIIDDPSVDFGPLPDGDVSVPDKPTQKLESGAVAQVPIMIGDNAQGGAFNNAPQDNFTAFISQPPWNALSPDKLRALYPVPAKFASDAEAIIALATDEQYRCPSAMFSNIFTHNTRAAVRRYVYGAVLPQFQIIPHAGTPEGSELPLVFGNLGFPLNGTMNATQVMLSKTLQTIWANFAKNPSQPPAPNWPLYTSRDKKVAALAFGLNIRLNNVVDVRDAASFDGACTLLDSLGQ